ncbi:hypothetical protein OXU80_18410 [Jeongeupella avenae]|uniref:Uncharacterized protein n=1 Tax=Antarcticirhabdus aurantiaca TaxID=2606717 RepID=A0ACD4NJ78_9HYPH|nr:hypothetical protein OXU80_18410 [Jeongeuplla avenae]
MAQRKRRASSPRSQLADLKTRHVEEALEEFWILGDEVQLLDADRLSIDALARLLQVRQFQHFALARLTVSPDMITGQPTQDQT